MNDNYIVELLISVGILFAIYLILRELNTWYWKINERISLQNRTNFLLEKILIKMGASDDDEIIVEDKETGNTKTVKTNDWIKFKNNSRNSDKVKVLGKKSDNERGNI